MHKNSVNDFSFLQVYFEQFRRLCASPDELVERLMSAKGIIVRASDRGNTIVLIGNGGSAAIASHVAVDLTKNAAVRAINFNEPDMITCFANDYGYEQWLAKAIEFYGVGGDVLIAVSSSGQSKNILNACRAARDRSFHSILTFSGFSPENPLRSLGDQNFWVDSRAYNHVETTHLFWLLAVVDLIVGKAEYAA